MKELNCRDVGFADCEGTIRGETEEEIMAQATAHGRAVHGMQDEDFTDDFVQKVRSAIRELV